MRVKANLTYSQFKELIPETFTKKRESGYGDFRVAVGQQASNFRAKHLPATKKVEDRQAQWRVWLGEIEFDEKWEFIKNIDDDTVNDMRQGKRDGEYAIAIYYRFHSLLKDPSFADAIDEAVFGEPLRNQRTEIFSKLEPFDIVTSTGRPIGVRQTTPHTTERRGLALPRLVLSDEQSTSDLHYSNRLVEVLGREKDQAVLQEFLKGRGIRWLQLAGSGGQGKSRLAHDLTLECRKDGRWHAGFLSDEDLTSFEDKWNDWQPEKPTLIVLDYVLGREISCRRMLSVLCKRSEDLRWPVRILLLERQPWNRSQKIGGQFSQKGSDFDSGLSLGSSQRAGWFIRLCGGQVNRIDGLLSKTRFQGALNGIIELTKLDLDDLVKITNQVLNQDVIKFAFDNDRLKGILFRLDQTGSPLYAYLLARSLSSGNFQSKWLREDLLTDELGRLQQTRWTAQMSDNCPTVGEDKLSVRLAVLATMIGRVDATCLYERADWQELSAKTVKEAVILADGYLGTDAIAPFEVLGLQPDILGEWFVLFSLERHLKKVLEPLAQLAWELDPEKFGSFLLRSAQDFPTHESVRALLRIAPRSEIARATYSSLSLDILNAIKATGTDQIPPRLLKEIKKAIEQREPKALLGGGYCYLEGFAFQKNLPLGFALTKKAADAGQEKAMYNLGICYLNGTGIKASEKRAVDWFAKAAEAGDTSAMLSLGSIYLKGDAVDAKKGVACLIKAMKAGDHDATFALGICRLYGKGARADARQAVRWFRKAAESAQHEAMYNLGLCYLYGDGVSVDPVEAITWFRIAIQAGDSRANFGLAHCYFEGLGVEIDTQRAIELTQTAANAGNADAMFSLSCYYQEGRFVDADSDLALEWNQRAAAAGHGKAMFVLAEELYFGGAGANRDEKKALDWFKKAADVGIVEAAIILGEFYIAGFGGGARKGEAFKWFKKAAEAGNSAGVAGLGNCYLDGIGIKASKRRAVELFQQSADAGNIEAMYALGVCYLNGVGGNDTKKAVDFIQRAAQAENVDAMFVLGVCYLNGHGLNSDPTKAIQWFLKAAENGDGRAMYNLSYCYQKGIGVLADQELSNHWSQKASENGHKRIHKNLIIAALAGVGLITLICITLVAAFSLG